MDDAIEFLRGFAQAEFAANRANYSEPDGKKLLQLVRAHDAMYAGDLRSGLSRPDGDPPGFFETPDQVAAAGRQQPRTVFAVARYQHNGADLYRGWLGDTEVRRRGEGIRQNLYVASVGGELKVIARYQMCNSCMAAKLIDGQPCGSCNGTGWWFRGGQELPALGPPLEVRKLAEPKDPVSKPAYAAIDDPA